MPPNELENNSEKKMPPPYSENGMEFDLKPIEVDKPWNAKVMVGGVPYEPVNPRSQVERSDID